VCQASLLSIFLPTLVIVGLFDSSYSNRYEAISLVILIYIFLMITGIEHFLAICMSSLEKYLFRSYVSFLTGLLVFLVLNCLSSLYILNTNPLSDVKHANIFYQRRDYLLRYFQEGLMEGLKEHSVAPL
jgi:hypothetical protein